jgi:trehalose/maltose transport system substrate-binding protein
MVRKHQIMPEAMINMDFEEAMEYFLAGRIAMVRVAATRWLQGVGRFGPGSIGYLPTPSFTEGKHSPSEISSWHFGVWSGSKNKELAGTVVEYLSSREADVLWTTIGGQLPNRKSTIRDNPEFFADPKNALLLAAVEDTHKNGWLPPPGAGEGGWNEAFNSAFQDVMINHADPKAALQNAETAFNRMRRR